MTGFWKRGNDPPGGRAKIVWFGFWRIRFMSSILIQQINLFGIFRSLYLKFPIELPQLDGLHSFCWGRLQKKVGILLL